MRQQERLELGERHLHALVLDQLLRAIGDVEPALLVDVADVAGVVPAVSIDGLCGVLGPVEIALHDLRSSDEQLAFLTCAEVFAGDESTMRPSVLGTTLPIEPGLTGALRVGSD